MNQSPDKRQCRAIISVGDFLDARRYIEAAGRHAVGTVEHEALLLSAINSYARPFSRNEVHDRAAADSKLTDLNLPAVLGADLPLHERIVRMRNKVVAHSEAEFHPASFIEPFVTDGNGRSTVYTTQRWQAVSENIDLAAFLRIANAMWSECGRRLLWEVPESAVVPVAPPLL